MVVILNDWLLQHHLKGNDKVGLVELRKRQLFKSVITAFDKPNKKSRKKKTTLSQQTFGDHK